MNFRDKNVIYYIIQFIRTILKLHIMNNIFYKIHLCLHGHP